MPRRKVEFLPDHFFHIYNRGNNRQEIFLEAENYRFFLNKLHSYYDPTDVDLVAYCLMPNHYHLITRIKQRIDFSNVMRSFSVSYIRSFNNLYRRSGHLFQGDFEARSIGADEHLAHVIRYVHLNPVRAGLVAKPDAWIHSDYREWISAKSIEDSIRLGVRTQLFGTGEEYRRHVDDRIGEFHMREQINRLLFG